MNKKQLEAIKFAFKQHENQRYGDNLPYSFHLSMVMEVAREFEFGDNDLIMCSCSLHDVIEDANLTYGDLKKEFGEEVADIVYAVTNELGKNRKERAEKTYPKIRESENAVIVKLCDRISNLRFSKANGSRMFKVYKDEYPEFQKALFDSKHQRAVELWEELSRLSKDD